MKKLIVLVLFFAPVLSAAYRPGEPAYFSEKLVRAAVERTRHDVRYDGTYRKIEYPNGDVPDDIGVCTDVVIRSYRKLGIDLQKDLHEDIKKHFNQYPKLWGLTRPDTHIDHRRVPNLQTFFSRKGIVLPATQNSADYVAGDIVTWVLPGNLAHIGIVIDLRAADGHTPLIVHNMGSGPVIEDILFDYRITGHYRYYGKNN